MTILKGAGTACIFAGRGVRIGHEERRDTLPDYTDHTPATSAHPS